MLKQSLAIILFCFATFCMAQNPVSKKSDSVKIARDSIKKAEFLKNLGNGFLPTNFFDLDLRYLIKFNQYEGFRTGLGGTTNKSFSDRYRVNGYLVYGFKDTRFKYSIGGGFRVNGDGYKVGLDYAYVNYSLLNFTHQFGLNFEF